MSTERAYEEIHAMLSRHVVALVWIDAERDTKTQRALVCTGTLVSVVGRQFILTAGHILQDLDEVLRRQDFVHCDIYGDWASDRAEDSRVAFNYPDCDRWFIYDEARGYDYGLIGVRRYYAAHLLALNMLPVTEPHLLDPPAALKNHVLIGMPSESVRAEPERDDRARIAAVTLANTMLPVIPIEKPPEVLVKRHKRFYGRVSARNEVRPGAVAIDDVDGMSGGPIFAVGERVKGEAGYWLVGVQSGWHPPSRVIAAGPVAEIFELLKQKYADFDAKAGRPGCSD